MLGQRGGAKTRTGFDMFRHSKALNLKKGVQIDKIYVVFCFEIHVR